MVFTNTVSANLAENLSNDIYQANLQLNQEETNEIFIDNPNGYITKNDINNLSVKINNNTKSLNLTGDVEVTIYGEIDEVEDEGFVGIFEGMINDEIPINADVTYTDEETFLILTIGYLGTDIFETAMFGSYSESLATINETKYNVDMRDFEAMASSVSNFYDSNDEGLVETQAVDATNRLQGSTSLYYVSGKPVSTLSVYHANQIRNQSNTKIYAKVNTNQANIKSYLKNYVYTSATNVGAIPDTFKIKITGKHSSFDMINNSCSPGNNTTTATISVPYLNASGGISLTSMTITTSKTTVTTSRYTSGGGLNVAEWNIYKNLGWTDVSQFEGSQSSSKGMTASLNMQYAGTVSSNVSRSITCNGSTRWIANVLIGGDITQYHFQTGTMTVNTSVTIVP